jgi:hypothetical protein
MGQAPFQNGDLNTFYRICIRSDGAGEILGRCRLALSTSTQSWFIAESDNQKWWNNL